MCSRVTAPENVMAEQNEKGIALIMTLLIMMLMSALLVGFTAVVTSDQRYRFIDRDRNQAFYGASAGVEKMTADLGNLFLKNVAPTQSQLTAMVDAVPTVPQIAFSASSTPDMLPSSSLADCKSPNTVRTIGTAGYSVKYCAAPDGSPTTTATPSPISTGPYEGLVAQQMPYQLDVTANTATGGEVHLVRLMEAVAIPVFQFGIFSDVDLSFFAGPDFNFGGRVHTNGNLFLSHGGGATLKLSDKVTAVKEIVREKLQNGESIDTDPAHTGTVSVATAPGSYRSLLRTEGSVKAGLGSDENEPTWHTTSLSTYNSWIRNGRTGAKPLNLSLITVGGTNTSLVQRPEVDEDTSNAALLSQRLFTKASLRILLSDKSTDITDLPTVSAAPPVKLDDVWRTGAPNNGLGSYGPVDSGHPPIALSPGLVKATITPQVSAGTGKDISFSGLTSADYFKVPDTLTVTKSGTTWTLTGCSAQKTATTFTCTAISPSHSSQTTTAGATVAGTVVTPDGSLTVQTVTTASWVNNGKVLTVASTMAFSPNSFWVGDSLVTCGGYSSGTTLTSCNVPTTISNNSKLTTAAYSNKNIGTVGGYLKIERQATDGSWNDVTMEILNYGIAGPNIVLGSGGVNSGGTACGDPTPDAIIRLQRLASNNWSSCPAYNNVSTDFWPDTLFDAREAIYRDSAPSGGALLLGGVMHYVTIDVGNLTEWFKGTVPAYALSTGTDSALDNGGYTVYFSDRRNNRNSSSKETGEYGYEDFVNPGASDGAPNGTLDAGEDLNANGELDVYGGTPNYNGTYGDEPPGATAPLTAAATPRTSVKVGEALVNRATFFRRALKLTNGSNIVGSGVKGLTVVSENPVYVQGNWNASGSFSGDHAATSVIADAVTLLSNNWSDAVSFTTPYAPDGRTRNTQTWYRMAIISGKGIAFPRPSGTPTDFGTDGGAHNFLRYLEKGDQPVNYRGSIATFFYNRQGVGSYKCCNTVYTAPTRNYAFDTDFLTPSKLPPNTPMFRDLNAVGFAQEMRPGK